MRGSGVPVDAGRLHRAGGDTMAGPPGRQALQVRGGRGGGLDMSLDTPALGQAHAGHDAVLMNVKPGAAWVKNLHRHLPLRTTPAGSPKGSNSSIRAPARADLAQSGVRVRLRVKLNNGLAAPRLNRPRCRRCKLL